jgi:tetratricopeptide (TPR) repeat protein
MKTNRSRLSWTLALATMAGLLGNTSARAEVPVVAQDQAGSVSVLWFSDSSKVKAAVRAWDRGAIAKAVRIAKSALRDPLAAGDLDRALLIACVGEINLDRPERAMRFCDRAVRLSGARDWRHLTNRANALLQAGHVARAIADYEQAIALQAEEASRAVADKSSPDSGSLAVDGALKANLDLALRRQAAGLEGVPAIAATSQKSQNETRLAGGHAGPR